MTEQKRLANCTLVVLRRTHRSRLPAIEPFNGLRMRTDFDRRYAEMGDDELLQAALDKQHLCEDARQALTAEMMARKLAEDDLSRQRSFMDRNTLLERVKRNRKLFGRRRKFSQWASFVFWMSISLAFAMLLAATRC